MRITYQSEGSDIFNSNTVSTLYDIAGFFQKEKHLKSILSLLNA